MKNRLIKVIPVVLLPLLTWLISAPIGLEAKTWHMFGLCLSLLRGLASKSLSEPVISLIVLGLGAYLIEKPAVLYSGYAVQGVWFLLAVLLACGAFKKAGLGEHLAYILLSEFGGTKFRRFSPGLGYATMLCDLILSLVTGSNTSRSAVVFLVFRGVPGSLGSYPDKDPQKPGGHLELSEHVVVISATVLFLTGMISNAVITLTIKDIVGAELTQMLWFKAALVPRLIVLFLYSLVMHKLYSPQMKGLGDTKPFVVSKVQEIGAMKEDEKILLTLFTMTILGQMLGGKIGINMHVVALAFLALELLLGTIDWNDLVAEKGTWNVYVWYSAFFNISGVIDEGGFYSWLSGQIQSHLDLSAVNGVVVLVVLLLISFVTKYFFVSSVAYIASIYPAILMLVASTNINIMTLFSILTFFDEYDAPLYNYGNGASIHIFGNGYVSQKGWYLKGTILLAMILVVFPIIGLPYQRIMNIC